MEKYRPIVGYETRYGISTAGEIMSFRRNQINKFTVSPSGYATASLYNGQKHKSLCVHVLVAKTYLQKFDVNQTQVDHINGNKRDNNLSNLRFVTASENGKNTHKNNKNMNRASRRPVCKLDSDDNVIETYESVISAARHHGLTKEQMIACCKHPHKTAAGHHWIYKKMDEKQIKLENDEIFKKIDEINGVQFDLYEISSYGKLRNIKTQKFIVPETSSGYARFHLHNGGVVKHFYAHRLVAYFFLEKNNKSKTVVNHIDENKMNNHYSNLEWCTYSQNSLHSMGKKVCKIDKDTGTILRTYNSGTCAAKALGKTHGQKKISDCCNTTGKSAYGFTWKFLETVINEMVIDEYIKITKKELIEHRKGTLVSYITHTGQLRCGRVLTNVENDKMIYTKDDKRFMYRLTNIKEIWVKKLDK